MTVKAPEIPAYPARGECKSVASQLERRRKFYQQQIEAIDKEIESIEQAFVSAFAKLDEQTTMRGRLDALAARTRTRRI